jgi:hypothetical protein
MGQFLHALEHLGPGVIFEHQLLSHAGVSLWKKERLSGTKAESIGSVRLT